MILPPDDIKELEKYNPMNQFLYFHSLRGKHKVKDAMMNEAYDIGLLPMKPYYEYSVAEIFVDDLGDHQIRIINFFNDRDKLIKFMGITKARDLVLFNHLPTAKEENNGIEIEPMVQLLEGDGTPFSSNYGLLGSATLPYHKIHRSSLEALRVKFRLDGTNDEQKEVFLADFACADSDTTDRLLNNRLSVDFMIFKYDAARGNTVDEKRVVLENIFIGSNNDRLRTNSNNKFLWFSCMYSGETGRRKERGGKIMGGNIINLGFFSKTQASIEVFKPVFLRPSNFYQLEEHPIAKSSDLCLTSREDEGCLFYWDKELKTFHTTDPEPMGFRGPRKVTVSDVIGSQGETNYQKWAKDHPYTGDWRSNKISLEKDPELQVIVLKSKK